MAFYATVPLREVCESIDYGYTASATTERVGPRFLRITDIVPARLDWDEVPFCEIEPKKLAKHRLRTGDIVIARTGATTGWAKFIKDPPEAVFASYLVRIRPSTAVNARFVGCIVESRVYKDFIQQHMGGAAQPNANAQVLTSYEIPLPPLQVQQRIADILNVYDELIENSQRRIRVLEEMARTLYREWFIDFRSPRHAGASRMASPLGDIPEGWAVCDLGKVCTEGIGIQTGPFGSQLHESDYSDDGVPVVMPKDLIGFRIRTDSIARIPEEMAEALNRHRMQPGDVVYGRRGDIGRRAYLMAAQAGWFCGTGCLRVRPNPQAVNGWYLFNYLGEDDVVGLIAGRAQGVTMPNLNTSVMSSVPVKLPPRELQEEFARLTFPMAEACEILIAKAENLRQTRDVLLPRLLSGQLAVGLDAAVVKAKPGSANAEKAHSNERVRARQGLDP